jgi:hypothetical protein
MSGKFFGMKMLIKKIFRKQPELPMSDTSNTIQIDGWGKFIAGVLLMSATAFAISTLMAYWPNKMPLLGKGDDAWYTATRYKITLIDNNDSVNNKSKPEGITKSLDSLNRLKDSLTKESKQKSEKKDSLGFRKDSIELKKISEAFSKLNVAKSVTANSSSSIVDESDRIHLNSLLLILVATMGFLGNMIHISASFTSFVGNGTFERSWLLWYFVKPFTAAGLAIIVYLIIRAGFLGYGTDPSSISLYGIMCLAALTGLFTDNATLKLKEIFDVVFKPKDERSGKLDDFKITVEGITPDKIDVNTTNKVNIKGKNFDKKKLLIKMNDTAILNAVIASTAIEFSYDVPLADRAKTSFEMVVTDENSKEIIRKKFST